MKPTHFLLLIIIALASFLPTSQWNQEVRCCSKKASLSEEEIFPLPASPQREASIPECRQEHSRCCFWETEGLRTAAALIPILYLKEDIIL